MYHSELAHREAGMLTHTPVPLQLLQGGSLAGDRCDEQHGQHRQRVLQHR